VHSIKVEGDVCESKTVTLHVPAAAAARVTFRQMDPCSISPEVGTFDVVVVNNMLDQCVSPKAPLKRMGGVNGIVHHSGTFPLLLHNSGCQSTICGLVPEKQS
jgi:hypothetical protein